MDTLNKKITKEFFETEDGFSKLEARWGQLMKDKVKLESSYHLLYAILRGKDWRKCFSPITNQTKLANGFQQYGSLKASYWRLKYHINNKDLQDLFGDILKPDVLTKIKSYIPEIKFGEDGLPKSAYRENLDT